MYINTDVEENWQIIEFLGLLAEDVPGVLFIDLEKGLKKYKANINEVRVFFESHNENFNVKNMILKTMSWISQTQKPIRIPSYITLPTATAVDGSLMAV